MNKTQYKSQCCNAKTTYSEMITDFIGEKKPLIGTITCICSKCKKPCAILIVERKKWEKNPATQIIPNKKEKIKRLFTEKELKKFREEEDF